jgi:hypothetical protein
MFPLGFCLGLWIGRGKMLEGKDEEWGGKEGSVRKG